MKLSIRNMVCDRCIHSVRELFGGLNIGLKSLELGSVETARDLGPEELEQIVQGLEARGFALIQDRESELIEQMKRELIHYIQHLEDQDHPEKLSVYIAGKLNYNYSYLSKLFSESEGETVETYLIRLKIERVKELLGYRKQTLSEIAWQLNYSSVQYLSNQFKKVTGQTTTEYLRSKQNHRKALDHI